MNPDRGNSTLNLSSAGAVAEEAESVLVALFCINSRVHSPCLELRFAFNAPLALASVLAGLYDEILAARIAVPRVECGFYSHVHVCAHAVCTCTHMCAPCSNVSVSANVRV